MKTDPDMALFPVGIITNEVKTPFLKSDKTGISMQGDMEKVMQEVRKTKTRRSRIVIRPEFVNLLTGIEAYSHLVVLYWAHLVAKENRTITMVHPMGRKQIPKVGIFCTASPVRPNPILTTVVKLWACEDNVLTVTGLDAVDQSPVLDIKPYVEKFHPKEETRIPAWMAQIIKIVNP
ncbi:tRNA (N6-threonylcarbamoyladenosine(37)-N6)-methyltransferase TrmO [Desulfobacter curvatus]|uniref:tRNA (N6-threonylcarbamoyladenosine(37)-N6)-methyltransferase TrmO n=1 Tax=Desulfobacter curvatus TaxID=2290 RepID=UPI00036C7193|nr:tRNA (N6-threonylcarbamoyladenosine(37)-N6)-methyltransferase TrmO [Desulfobacter curvatus]